MKSQADIHLTLKLAISTGEALLASGAETRRVEDTMIRILQKAELENIEAFSTPTGIFACANSNGEVSTVFCRVKNRSNNFASISRINEMSRQFVGGKIDVNSALARLDEIKKEPPYPHIIRIFLAALASLCFAMVFGGSIWDSLNSFVAAFLMQILIIVLEKHLVVSVLRNIAGGFISAFVSLFLLWLGLGQNMDFAIIGSIMPLVPGVSLTNAIRDILEGDLLSGTARAMDAILVAIGIAVGVGFALQIWFSFLGGY